VDTLVRRGHDPWFNNVSLWVQDEAHHVLKANKWGKAARMFPNAKGLGVTATPIRADGKGLGRHHDGLMDVMVEGPTMRELIDMGYLTDYRIFAPPSDLDLTKVPTSAGGDFSPKPLHVAVQKSHIVGDVVAHYLKIARGKLGITFTDSVETATQVADEYNRAGVPAAVVSAKTPDAERIAILKRFKARELLQLVNVDIFGEGFDLPAISVVSFARPTQSFSLFCQQFGRALRLMDGKEVAIIIDHVGNVQRHGLPDAHHSWTLDRREKRASKVDDSIPVRTCPECVSVYERTFTACPYCGHKPIPAERGGPEFVDGDLTELDAETLAEMRGEVERIDGPFYGTTTMNRPAMIRGGRIHSERQQTQEVLRASIAWWAGVQRGMGRADPEIYKRFYFAFGVDVMTAQALNSADAIELAEKVNLHLGGL
jgi:superfamily II DNA or RNA helicase